MKIIIIGAGEVGYHIAQKLSEENQEVLLIDKDPEKVKRITENLDIQAVLGYGTSPRMLRDSGVDEAELLVAATDSDEVNLTACLVARHLNPHILKVARVRNPEYLEEREFLARDPLAIDHIINPESVMVETILNLMTVPGASDVIDFAEGRIKLFGITIRPDSPLVGRPLLSFKGTEGRLLVGAIVRGDQVIIPRGDDTLQAYDLAYVVGITEELPYLFKVLDVQVEESRRVVIVGAGLVGTALATALDKTKMNVKIIDRDSQRCTDLAEKLNRVIVINGDGSDRGLLEEENISHCDFTVAITDDEESNVLISLLAKGLGVKNTITRISNFSYIPLASAIGLNNVVSPRLSAVRAILQYIRKGRIISVAPLKGEHAEAIEAEALDTSEIIDVPLSRANFPRGTLLGAIVRNGEIIIPRGDSVVKAKDRLIIFTLSKAVPKLEKRLTVRLEYI